MLHGNQRVDWRNLRSNVLPEDHLSLLGENLRWRTGGSGRDVVSSSPPWREALPWWIPGVGLGRDWNPAQSRDPPRRRRRDPGSRGEYSYTIPGRSGEVEGPAGDCEQARGERGEGRGPADGEGRGAVQQSRGIRGGGRGSDSLHMLDFNCAVWRRLRLHAPYRRKGGVWVGGSRAMLFHTSLVAMTIFRMGIL